MITESEFEPMWAVPPGKTISDLMKSKGISSQCLSKLADMSQEAVDQLLVGKHILDFAVASRLASIFGASADFWLHRERQYREQLEKLSAGVDHQSDDYRFWLNCLPRKEMKEFGWVDATKDKAKALRAYLDFFDVPNLDAWRRTYVDMRAATAFRTTDAYLENAPATSAWLRKGELEAEKLDCRSWNPDLFKAQFQKIRRLTQIASPLEFIPALQNLCAEAGVAVVVVKAPKGCRASGATFFANPKKAVLLLSFRYLSDDQFWFSFFHEAAHLVLHWDPDLLLLETSDSPYSEREEEANRFASDQLIPLELQQRLPEASRSLKGIMRLARDAGVSYGIIVGQMQFRGLLRREYFNRLKTKYRWGEI